MWKGFALFVLLFMAACAPTDAATPDLYMAAKYSQATADAAQYESKYLGEQLTATAEAPIVHITETAAAFQIQSAGTQQAYTATAQSVEATTTAALTATAGSWTATAVQNAAIIEAASQEAQQTAIANNTERDNLQLARQRSQNNFNAALPGLSAVALMIVLGMGLFMLIRQQSFRPIPRDARGDAVPMLNVIDGTYADVDKALYPQIGMKRSDLKLLPVITAADQKAVTERHQLIHLATNGLASGSGQDQKARQKIAGQQMVTPLLTANSEVTNRFQILPDHQGPPTEFINAEVVQVLENDWKEGTR